MSSKQSAECDECDGAVAAAIDLGHEHVYDGDAEKHESGDDAATRSGLLSSRELVGAARYAEHGDPPRLGRRLRRSR